MAKERLKELLEFAKTTDLQEIHWEAEGVIVHFRRSADAVFPLPSASVPEPEAAPSASAAVAEPQARPVIRSTMVGTFYRAESKDRPPLVIEGTRVSASQPVATIEAMKILKDVLAPSNCRIVKALVENGHAVEYGQPLFEIEEDVEPENV